MLELHCHLLGDKLRHQKFHEALSQVVKPGVSTISDIGSGTGLLSFMAFQLGAKHCFCFEGDPAVLKLSKKLAQKNKFKNITFQQNYSFAIKKPVKTDLVISETIGNFLLGEHLLEIMRDAKRFLKPGGHLIPCAARQFVAPMISSRIYDKLNVWDSIGYGLHVEDGKQACLNNVFVETVRQEEVLEVRQFDELNFETSEKSIRESRVEWGIENDAVISGFAVWWEADLIPGVTISTSPHEKPTHWQQVFLPLLNPMSVKKGNHLELMIHSDTRLGHMALQWTAIVRDSKGKELSACAMDSRKSIH